MKKVIIVWVVLLWVIISGCGKTPNESSETSTPGSEQKPTPVEKTPQPESSSTSEAPQASDNISGVWTATGQEDGVSSTWYFNNGRLVVNYEYHFSYEISKNKDPNGYTVVTIKNSEGKQQHALLLKRNGSHFEGITVEGEAYKRYSADGTVPKGQQLIEFTFQKNAWGSMDEAIDFYENTHKNTNNEISKEISWNNYRRDLWSLVKEGTSGNTITLHFTNISGAGGSFNQLVKNAETTVITFYDGNAGYPTNPTTRYTVQNSDYKVIKTEELWKQ
jgi:hypothetical protein